jgi:hypothetical protein
MPSAGSVTVVVPTSLQNDQNLEHLVAGSLTDQTAIGLESIRRSNDFRE